MIPKTQIKTFEHFANEIEKLCAERFEVKDQIGLLPFV